ncbi:MAG: mycofactocin biosynthesis peptidyl-dipeptidase MftE, partial [Frankia sp.]
MEARAGGERRLDRLAWPDLAVPDGGALPLVVLPLGSTEQHGPHLPAGTDTTVAVALAAALARHRSDVLVAPALAYGASGEHAGFPATVSLGAPVLELAVVELVRSLDATARGVVLVNGHGGNAVAVARATRLLRSEGRRVLGWAPRPSAPGRGDLHAGRDETSLMLHLAPELVRPDAATAGPSPSPSVADLVRHGVRALSRSGVLGDPAGASADEGARL